MRFYRAAYKENPNTPIRLHPLLLSLSRAINASETNPDISTISENDKRVEVLGNNLYISPSALPPLEMHVSGKNSTALLSNQNGYALILLAGCRECMSSAPQDSSAGEDYAAPSTAPPISPGMEDNSGHMGATASTRNKGKKRRRASSGSVRGNLLSTRGPKAAALIRATKGRSAQKAGSRNVNTSSEEGASKKSSQGRDRGVEPCALIRSPVQHRSHDTRRSLQAHTSKMKS